MDTKWCRVMFMGAVSQMPKYKEIAKRVKGGEHAERDRCLDEGSESDARSGGAAIQLDGESCPLSFKWAG